MELILYIISLLATVAFCIGLVSYFSEPSSRRFVIISFYVAIVTLALGYWVELWRGGMFAGIGGSILMLLEIAIVTPFVLMTMVRALRTDKSFNPIDLIILVSCYGFLLFLVNIGMWY